MTLSRNDLALIEKLPFFLTDDAQSTHLGQAVHLHSALHPRLWCHLLLSEEGGLLYTSQERHFQPSVAEYTASRMNIHYRLLNRNMQEFSRRGCSYQITGLDRDEPHDLRYSFKRTPTLWLISDQGQRLQVDFKFSSAESKQPLLRLRPEGAGRDFWLLPAEWNLLARWLRPENAHLTPNLPAAAGKRNVWAIPVERVSPTGKLISRPGSIPGDEFIFIHEEEAGRFDFPGFTMRFTPTTSRAERAMQVHQGLAQTIG